MNFVIAMTAVFCLVPLFYSYLIFENCWRTSYGAKIPFKRIQPKGKWLLLIPGSLAIVGTFSFFDGEWGAAISLMPKLMAISCYLTVLFFWLLWYRSPDPLSMPIDVVVKHYWRYAQRVDLAKMHPQGSDTRKRLDAKDTFTIPGTTIEALLMMYLEYLRSIGQVLIGHPTFEKVPGAELFAITTHEFGDPEIEYVHEVMYVPDPGVAAFSSEVNIK